jgi:hypothetical protein
MPSETQECALPGSPCSGTTLGEEGFMIPLKNWVIRATVKKTHDKIVIDSIVIHETVPLNDW